MTALVEAVAARAPDAHSVEDLAHLAALRLRMHEGVAASGSTRLQQLLEAVEDEQVHLAAAPPPPQQPPPAWAQAAVAPPLRLLHVRLQRLQEASGISDGKRAASRRAALRAARAGLLHHARTEGAHVLESSLLAALLAVEHRELDLASHILVLFPLLCPLVVAMAWDLLPSATTTREAVVQQLWPSCLDLLCNQLQYRLMFAAVVRRAKEGSSGSSAGGGDAGGGAVAGHGDFVANLVIERLATHSPIRVLVDIVPELPPQHALELVEGQPLNGGPEDAACRKHDAELLHMSYGLQEALRVVQAMESGVVAADPDDLLHGLDYHLGAIASQPRRVLLLLPAVFHLWLIDIIINVLHMDSRDVAPATGAGGDGGQLVPLEQGGSYTPLAYMSALLSKLQEHVPSEAEELAVLQQPNGAPLPSAGLTTSALVDVAKTIWWERACRLRALLDDWQWRLAVLRRMAPAPQRAWQWHEMLAVLRAAPSTLLNMCVQRAEFALGEEALQRFDLPPEEAALLQLAEWVDRAMARASVEGAISRMAEGSLSIEALDFAAHHAELSPLASVMLCLDIATTSARSPDMVFHLLDKAKELLPLCREQADAGKDDPSIVDYACQMLAHLQEMQEEDPTQPLQRQLAAPAWGRVERRVPGQRALNSLMKLVEAAHQGKRQFLSGELNNLVKALSDDSEGLLSPRTHSSGKEGRLLGHVAAVRHELVPALKNSGSDTPRSPPASEDAMLPPSKPEDLASILSLARPLEEKLPAPLRLPTLGRDDSVRLEDFSSYLAAFIHYVATIGDIVDDVDPTHTFDYFSLLYERPSDLLTRLVFERGNARAASKVAAIMGQDLVQQVVSACVPPVLPPPASDQTPRWASVALPDRQLYQLQLEVVRHLADLNPIRAILACIFGEAINTHEAKQLEDFAIEQSTEYPVLRRWIGVQLEQRRLEALVSGPQAALLDVQPGLSSKSRSMKRARKSGMDSSNAEQVPTGTTLTGRAEAVKSAHRESVLRANSAVVMRLTDEGKLREAVALADKFDLQGAPDSMLKALASQPGPDTWKYCMRLHDRKLAAELALKSLVQWDLLPALEVLTMCTHYLQLGTSLWSEVKEAKQKLQRYRMILQVDDQLSTWQEVELQCNTDPEGLALRLAERGKVDAAIEVGNLCQLPKELRCELQGRHLVDIVKGSPLDSKGSAAALQYLGRIQEPEDALAILLVALEQLTSIHTKQLLVKFLLKRQGERLAVHELQRLQRLALVLGMLAKLPPPWQLRCARLHEHPHLILESLLMWKQTAHVAQLLQGFPELKDDDLLAVYAAKAIASEGSGERTFVAQLSGRLAAPSPPPTPAPPGRGVGVMRRTFAWSLASSPREARRSPSAKPRRSLPSVSQGLPPSQKAAWEAMTGNPVSTAGPGRQVADVGLQGQESVLTGNEERDAAKRLAHTYENAPSAALCEAILALCSSNEVAARLAVTLSEAEITRQLSGKDGVASINLEKAYHAALIFAKVLSFAQRLLQGLHPSSIKTKEDSEGSSKASEADCADDSVANGDKNVTNGQLPARQGSGIKASGPSRNTIVSKEAPLSEVVRLADQWRSRMELLCKLLKAGYTASADDLSSDVRALALRDQLLQEERFELALQTCVKCQQLDEAPVWMAWGQSLLLIGHYNEAWIKVGHVLRGAEVSRAAEVALTMVHCIESSPPTDVPATRQLYVHMERSVNSASEDALSADSYLDVLHIPPPMSSSLQPRRVSGEWPEGSYRTPLVTGAELPASHLDDQQYKECERYLREYAKRELPAFQFRHGKVVEACRLFFPVGGLPPSLASLLPPSLSSSTNSLTSLQTSAPAVIGAASSQQKLDPFGTQFGTLEDLCELCVAFGAMDKLEDVISIWESNGEDGSAADSGATALALTRLAAYCEAHRHFSHLYRLQILQKDVIAAGLTSIQLFHGTATTDQAVRLLEQAKVSHHTECTLRRVSAYGSNKQGFRVRVLAFAGPEVEVLKAFTDAEGPPWMHSIFGNANDSDSTKKKCEVAEALAERAFPLAFRVVYELALPAAHVWAAAAANLADRHLSRQLAELLAGIRGTLDEADWDSVLGAAIAVYARTHRERPDKLIDQLSSDHRRVLACVMVGRLKSAFQFAARANSTADVEYVSRQLWLSITSFTTEVLIPCGAKAKPIPLNHTVWDGGAPTPRGIFQMDISPSRTWGFSPRPEAGRMDRSVYRAISQVASSDVATRQGGIDWLEGCVRSGETDMLEVASPAHLQCLLPLASSRRMELRATAMRALAALARLRHNRPLIVEAGLLEHVVDILCSGDNEGGRAAVHVISSLASEDMLLGRFSMSGISALVGCLHVARDFGSESMTQEGQQLQAAACTALARLAGSQRNRLYTVQMKGIKWLMRLVQLGQTLLPELRGSAMRAIAALSVEEDTQQQIVELDGLKYALRMCEEDTGLPQESAFWALAALSTNSELRYQIAAQGGLRLLCNASCAAEKEMQRAAAAALGNLCSDAVIINGVVREEGLWSVIAMAQSPHPEVQRLAARAFWHLAVHSENKRQVMAMGGLQSLLTLSRLGARNQQATLLAEEALQKLGEDPEIEKQLEREEDYRVRALSFHKGSSPANSGPVEQGVSGRGEETVSEDSAELKAQERSLQSAMRALFRKSSNWVGGGKFAERQHGSMPGYGGGESQSNSVSLSEEARLELRTRSLSTLSTEAPAATGTSGREELDGGNTIAGEAKVRKVKSLEIRPGGSNPELPEKSHIYGPIDWGEKKEQKKVAVKKASKRDTAAGEYSFSSSHKELSGSYSESFTSLRRSASVSSQPRRVPRAAESTPLPGAAPLLPPEHRAWAAVWPLALYNVMCRSWCFY
eukprot:SM000036S13314  [mRNA]  locus=s36:520792:538386:- [translate_table: standard]